MHPSATLPLIVMVEKMGIVTENERVDDVPDTVGAGEFFCAHHSLVPPHGHGPENEIVMVMMLVVGRHDTST